MKFDSDLPIYHKGHNMYDIYKKVIRNEILTAEEEILMQEVQEIYCKKKLDRKEISIIKPVTLVNIWKIECNNRM